MRHGIFEIENTFIQAFGFTGTTTGKITRAGNRGMLVYHSF